MRRLRLTLLALLVASCGERAALVDFEVAARGDALCVWAWGDGERVFVESYDVEADQDRPASGSLTFLAGSRVSDEVRIGARVLRGGAVAGEARGVVRFTDELVQTRLRVRRCAPHDAAPSMSLSPIGSLPGEPGVEVADLDGDGADELAVLAGGALHVLRGRELTSTPVEASVVLAASGDTDGDCAVELVGVSEGEVRLLGAAGAPGEPIAAGARDASFGSFTASEGPELALATASGLSIVALRGSTTTEDGAFDSIAAADFDADGFDDVVASGAGGTRYFLGGASGLREVTNGLPPRVASAVGPIVTADLDGDDRLDLAVADGTALRFAIDRGDGLFEERGGASPIVLGAPIARLRSGDVDGDCRDEVIAIATEGSAIVARVRDGVPIVVDGSWPASIDAEVGDFDGDGARELAWITTSGEVQAWRP